MKRYLFYILHTSFYHFCSYFSVTKSKIKFITYNIQKLSNNKILLKDSHITKTSFTINGKNNQIIIKNGTNISFCSFFITGSNNTICLDGSSGIVSITLRGNGCNVSIGKNTSMAQCYMVCMGQNNSITIGSDCMFSENIELWNSDTHLITDRNENALNPSRPIIIKDHVWVGKHVKILKGVTIGNNSILGLGSIVSKNIAAHSIAAGNPARIVKENINWKKGFINI